MLPRRDPTSTTPSIAPTRYWRAHPERNGESAVLRASGAWSCRSLDSALAGLPLDSDTDVVEVVRGERRYAAPCPAFELAARDVVTLRADRPAVRALASAFDLWPLPWVRVADLDVDLPAGVGILVEVRVPSGSDLADQRVGDVRFRQRYEATILAVRREETVVRDQFEDVVLEVDDTLLVRTAGDNVEVLRDTANLVVTAVAAGGPIDREPTGIYREEKAPTTVAVVAGVVAAAALGVVSIAIAALAAASSVISIR